MCISVAEHMLVSVAGRMRLDMRASFCTCVRDGYLQLVTKLKLSWFVRQLRPRTPNFNVEPSAQRH